MPQSKYVMIQQKNVYVQMDIHIMKQQKNVKQQLILMNFVIMNMIIVPQSKYVMIQQKNVYV